MNLNNKQLLLKRVQPVWKF